MSFINTLKSFDAYPKLNDEFKVKTFGGAIVSLCSISLILLLFFSELSLYLQVETSDHLVVDVSRGEKLRINFDVTFPHIPCSLLSVDAMDVSGSHQLDVSHHILKKSLDKDGNFKGDEIKHELGVGLKESEVRSFVPPTANSTATQNSQSATNASATDAPTPVLNQDAAAPPNPSSTPTPTPTPAVADPTKKPGYCGPCYGAELRVGQCCNTCDEVKDGYRARGWALANLHNIEQCVASGQTEDELMIELQRGDGCKMVGYLEVNKVAGNFHFAPGKSFQHGGMHIHDLAAFGAHVFNVSHLITSISFGDPYPGMINPLDNTEKILTHIEGGGMFMYYQKVVPTTYSSLSGSVLNTNQFSVTEHFRPVSSREGQGLPGVFFFYELSPIMVKFSETRKSLPHFLTQLCAIIGGVFTVAGMIDKLVYSSFKHLQKGQQGKLI